MEGGGQRGQFWVGGKIRGEDNVQGGMSGRVQRRESVVGDKGPQSREIGVGWDIRLLRAPRVMAGFGGGVCVSTWVREPMVQ